MRKCDQQCGREAQVYAGDTIAGGWAGAYCDECVPKGFMVWEQLQEIKEQA